jgi:plastocyanin
MSITRTSPRRLLSGLLVAAFGLAVVGCGADEDHGGHGDDATPPTDHVSAPVSDGARVIAVTGEDFAFDPKRIEIAAGEEVAIELTAVDLEHDLVIDGVEAHIHADPGETTTGGLRISEPGTYTAYCSVPGHREAGMTATIVVTD